MIIAAWVDAWVKAQNNDFLMPLQCKSYVSWNIQWKIVYLPPSSKGSDIALVKDDFETNGRKGGKLTQTSNQDIVLNYLSSVLGEYIYQWFLLQLVKLYHRSRCL